MFHMNLYLLFNVVRAEYWVLVFRLCCLESTGTSLALNSWRFTFLTSPMLGLKMCTAIANLEV